MLFRISTLLSLALLAQAAPTSKSKVVSSLSNVQYLTSNNSDVSISLVENSGVCETTPGVTTYSGYINIANNTEHFFFWFFEARNNPEKAPFAAWFNGGPGCSSLIGLFQENGPCHVNTATNETYLNPYSWNNYSNMIYIDQPIGTGFSYGDDTVNSTVTAAPPVWHVMQTLFENGHFSKYESRELGLWTESYGGHYGPEFVTYFEEQNAKIDNGEISGEKIDISVLGINNGWYDPIIQNLAYSQFARYNPTKAIINDTTYQQMQHDYWMPDGCYDQEKACYATGNDTICQNADNFCGNTQFNVGIGDLDSYDILDAADVNFPPENYLNILADPTVMAKIGAKSTFQECADAPYEGFYNTGDDARTQLPNLQKILNDGKVRTLIWAGDLDYNCNVFGSIKGSLRLIAEKAIDRRLSRQQCLEDPGWTGSSEFKSQSYRDAKYSGNGTTFGQAKSVDNMTFLSVYGAGHEVPAYRPAAAYQVFVSMMKGEKI